MIPPTKNGLAAMACLSAMQKCIRRSLEAEAMTFAVELIHTSKGFNTMVCNRLVIISHEDIDTMAHPEIVAYVFAATEGAKAMYQLPNPGKSRMLVGNALRLMSRAPKSREGDHFQAAIGLKSLIAGHVPEIPDWALDGHTLAGKRKGRGLEYFLQESTKLVPTQAVRDAYADDAARMWKLKEREGRSGRRR